MTVASWDEYLRSLPDVSASTAYGYRFYFIGDDDRMPFTTIADTDNDWDKVSALHRDGVYRLNIGVKRETFEQMFPGRTVEGTDYTALNVFLPHPEYAAQSFVCILNPAGENVACTRAFIAEAHAQAVGRRKRGP